MPVDKTVNKTISRSDAAILALIAENPSMTTEEAHELVQELSNDEVASIAWALLDEHDITDEAVLSTARSLRAWADSNKKAAAAGS